MTHLPQIIIAPDIGERFLGKAQGLRRLDRWNRRCPFGEAQDMLAIGQPVLDKAVEWPP